MSWRRRGMNYRVTYWRFDGNSWKQEEQIIQWEGLGSAIEKLKLPKGTYLDAVRIEQVGEE